MGKTGEPTDLTHADDIAAKATLDLGSDPQVVRVITCGSVRRRRPIVSDVDLLVVTKAEALSDLTPHGAWHLTAKQGNAVMDGVWVELWLCPPVSVGAMMAFLTGPASLNVWMRQQAIRRGLKLSQYGLLRPDGGREERVVGDPISAEKALFDAMLIPWITPEERDEWRTIYGVGGSATAGE